MGARSRISLNNHSNDSITLGGNILNAFSKFSEIKIVDPLVVTWPLQIHWLETLISKVGLHQQRTRLPWELLNKLFMDLGELGERESSGWDWDNLRLRLPIHCPLCQRQDRTEEINTKTVTLCLCPDWDYRSHHTPLSWKQSRLWRTSDISIETNLVILLLHDNSWRLIQWLWWFCSVLICLSDCKFLNRGVVVHCIGNVMGGMWGILMGWCPLSQSSISCPDTIGGIISHCITQYQCKLGTKTFNQ